MNKRTRFLTTFVITFVGFSTLWGQQPPLRPKLVLVLSIDQMRFDYLTRFAPLYTGGLRTLVERGAVYSNAHYRHAAAETGPGHSVLLSGRHPSHSGIVANEWWDPYLKKPVNVVDDPFQLPLGGEGRSASPANALSFTVGDVLKLKNARSRVVGVSLKDRSAILMAGRRGDAAYWYEVAGGNFITSTYYTREAPRWLVKWNSQHLPNRYAGKKWTRLLADEELYEKYAGADAIEGEWDRRDTVFPHAIRGKPPERLYYDDFRRTPFADEVTLSIALEAMKAHQLGQDDDTDIFAIGFSATDVVGHTYGADSQEIMDQLLRLDLILEKLFKEIDGKVGLANTLVVLSADHGSLPLVENLRGKGIEARRASPKVLENAVHKAFEQRFPGVNGLIAYFATDIYLNDEVVEQHHLDRTAVEETAIKALMSTGLVEKVYTHSDLMSTANSTDAYLKLFQNAFFQPRSPHLSVLVKKYVYLGSQPGGTGHGTAHDYDRHVPIVFMGEGIKPGTYEAESGPEDIAPTLAHLLGLAYPREYDSRLLTEMLVVQPASSLTSAGLKAGTTAGLKAGATAGLKAGTTGSADLQVGQPRVPSLDFEFFKTRVQPIFLEKRPGFTRCVVCHTGGGNVGFLQPLSPGATTWNEEQSRLNFDAVARLVTPGEPLKSRLLMHPLEPAAGGDEFHNGGRQFTSQNDPQFQTIAAWVRGQTAGGSDR